MYKPTEKEIKKALNMLERSSPEKATRENAIKAVQGIKAMAGMVVNKIDKDLKTGKVKVSESGEVTRQD